jgi:hypothetical protein
MINKTNYIRAVLVVFWLLILTRVPAFMTGDLDVLTLVSTVVEVAFFIFGIVVLRSRRETGPKYEQ